MQQVVAMIIDYCCWKMLHQLAIFYLDYFDNLFKAADTDINYSDYFDFDNANNLFDYSWKMVHQWASDTDINYSIKIINPPHVLIAPGANNVQCTGLLKMLNVWKCGAFLNNQYGV